MINRYFFIYADEIEKYVVFSPKIIFVGYYQTQLCLAKFNLLIAQYQGKGTGSARWNNT